MARIKVPKYVGVYKNKYQNGHTSYSYTYTELATGQKRWVTLGTDKEGYGAENAHNARIETIARDKHGELPLKLQNSKKSTLFT